MGAHPFPAPTTYTHTLHPALRPGCPRWRTTFTLQLRTPELCQLVGRQPLAREVVQDDAERIFDGLRTAGCRPSWWCSGRPRRQRLLAVISPQLWAEAASAGGRWMTGAASVAKALAETHSPQMRLTGFATTGPTQQPLCVVPSKHEYVR